MSVKTTKPYVYRKHLREPVKLLLCSLLFFIVTLTYPSLTLLVSTFSSFNTNVIKLIAISIIPAIIGASSSYFILYFVLFRKLKKVCVTLEDDKLVYHNGKKLINIPYQDITALKFPSIKYTGGWLKIVYGKKNIRLTVVLENIGEFVKELKEKLDSIDKSNIYKENKIYTFYKTACYSDESWERVYEYFSSYLKAILINMGVIFFVSLLTSEKSEKFVLCMVAMLCLMTSFIVSELILTIIFSRKNKNIGFTIQPRDKNYEIKIHKTVSFIAIMLQIVLIAYIFII